MSLYHVLWGVHMCLDQMFSVWCEAVGDFADFIS